MNYCQQIENNNVMGDERVGELHNDEPSEHELTDSDDMYAAMMIMWIMHLMHPLKIKVLIIIL